ncbi:hypothetical protein STEG23_033388, partial [Scotinomys teguina]
DGTNHKLAIPCPGPISLSQPLKNAVSRRKTWLWDHLMERSSWERNVSSLEFSSMEIQNLGTDSGSSQKTP